MEDALYERILDDLAGIRYKQTLIWSRYHEPMAHPSIFERLVRARARLPEAYLVLVSNGDYLNRETLSQLERAGVNRLMLDLYLPEGKERVPAEIEDEKKKFSTRTGLELSPIGEFDYRCLGSSIQITMGIPCYTGEHVSTRGGLVEIAGLHSYQRRAVCFNPLHSVVVDYNGKGMLCCQVRSDSAAQSSAIIGDLAQPGYTLFHLYRDLAPRPGRTSRSWPQKWRLPHLQCLRRRPRQTGAAPRSGERDLSASRGSIAFSDRPLAALSASVSTSK